MADEMIAELFCSFCGKSQEQVRKLIAGPAVFICDECISLCADIMKDEDIKDLFEDKAVADELIDNLLIIEKNDPDKFRYLCGYIRGVLIGLRSVEKQKRKKSSQKK